MKTSSYYIENAKKDYIKENINSIDAITVHRLFLECVSRNHQAVITEDILDSIDFLINNMNDNNSSSLKASLFYIDEKTSLCLELSKMFKGNFGSPDVFAEATGLNERLFYYINKNKRNNMDFNTLLSIIFGLGLNEERAIILFSLSRHNYNTVVKPIHKKLLRLNIKLNINIINAYLIRHGHKPLGSSTYKK